jgi:[FeFe] hydrogenase H-cluster maturation GTPase HydF
MSKGRESKPHIGIFGRTNVGKSAFINAITGQDVSIVSPTAGTTTDPVKKSVELTGIGPVILIDTAGIDDTGELGMHRVKRSRAVLNQIDMALLIIAENSVEIAETELIASFKAAGIAYAIIHNKQDVEPLSEATKALFDEPVLPFCSVDGSDIWPLIDLIKSRIPESAYSNPTLLGDLIKYGDIVLLIVPIDIEAPQGRLILPQVQAIRDILDNDAIAIVVKERETEVFLQRTGIKPDLVVTDSSIFLKADAMIPADVPLTGFSVVLARLKGDFDAYLKGTPAIDTLKNGDKILLLESCTHHSSCDDIGRVKIPRWMSQYTGKTLDFEVVAGLDSVPGSINDYALVVQCGGCMITRRQIQARLEPAKRAGIPVTNYGMAIAWMQGVYNRAIAPFTKNVSHDPYL